MEFIFCMVEILSSESSRFGRLSLGSLGGSSYLLHGFTLFNLCYLQSNLRVISFCMPSILSGSLI